MLQRNQETYSLGEANAAAVNKRSALIAAVKTALDFQKGELNPGEKHEVVVCVFDRDEHALFDEACSLAKANKLRTARSWLWSATAQNSYDVVRCLMAGAGAASAQHMRSRAWGRISKQGNRQLRTLLIHGARSVVRTAAKIDDAFSL